jgi:hypothetical protein
MVKAQNVNNRKKIFLLNFLSNGINHCSIKALDFEAIYEILYTLK